ncbi:EsaB/YukD family protein [Paenibacillus alkalitolerans]|uniref:EsaB/YukD family protein n=1 Tax=Paenibacillus alkalitolerans TaxID=2799335 RepID=UPI0018F2E3E1|nr:EsaB/YukD family protein [Paenibacillus alkalitolerans]
MDYVMVTFEADNNLNVDLKIPLFVTPGELISMLSEALGVSFTPENRLQAEPLGRILAHDRTLADEGVAHGALLTLI